MVKYVGLRTEQIEISQDKIQLKTVCGLIHCTIIGSLLDDYVAGLRWCCGVYRAAYACHLDHEADIGMSRLGRFPTYRGRP